MGGQGRRMATDRTSITDALNLRSMTLCPWILFLCCASGPGPSSLRTCTIRDSADTLILRYTFYTGPGRDTVRHGRYERWYPNGRKAEEGYYVHGRKDSVWLEWDTAGQQVLQEHWRHGVRHGFYRRVDMQADSGSAGLFVDGVKEGCWRESMGRSTGWREGCYRNDERSGLWVEHLMARRAFVNGANGWYVDNKKEGKWVFTSMSRMRGVGQPPYMQCFEMDYRAGELVSERPCTKPTLDSIAAAAEERRRRGKVLPCEECGDLVKPGSDSG